MWVLLGKIIVATSFECLPKKQKKSPNLVTLKLYSDPSSYSECSLVIVSIKYIEEIRYYGWVSQSDRSDSHLKR